MQGTGLLEEHEENCDRTPIPGLIMMLGEKLYVVTVDLKSLAFRPL